MKICTGWIVFLGVLFAAFPAHAAKAYPFKGEVNFKQNTFSFDVDINEKSSVKLTGEKPDSNGYSVALQLEHIYTPVFDLSTQLQSQFQILKNTRSDSPLVFGKLWSQYSLVNYKPSRELSGLFEIKNDKLQFTSLSVGNLSLNGFLQLKEPFNLDLSLDLVDVGMEDFIKFWMMRRSYESAGNVTGRIEVSGHLDNIILKGSLESYDGFIKSLEFDRIRLNAQGVFPNITIAKSSISKSNGMIVAVDGDLNLTDRANFKRQIRELALSPLVKETQTEAEWTIRRLSQDDSNSSTALKYQLRKSTRDDYPSEVDAGMISIERKLEF